MSKLKLSVVDQSPLRTGGTAADAINETIALAKATEQWGYYRFWVAEHHSTSGFAGPSPEILITRIAAETKSIRVGSGGVMLSHYSPLKVAENFRILETMNPGRIDLGIGRAPGGDQYTSIALAYGTQVGGEYFGTRVADTLAFLTDSKPATEILAHVRATPRPDTVPEVWMLGSSDQSALLAAHFGLAFSFAHFIAPHGGPEIVQQYRDHFRPSKFYGMPRANVGVFVLCADTDQEAKRIASSRDLWRLRFEKGELGPYPSPEEVDAYEFTDNDRALIGRRTIHSIIGGPDKVKAELTAFADMYGVNELIILTICYDFKDRLHSYELLAKMFELEAPEKEDAA
ncbi:MAG: LLM class flavin-dependent oxidoreductase [Proteobacteria bacterium]|nr:LLM class flavin-dependent oxidoreductase [Pseudomonadota bacterium]